MVDASTSQSSEEFQHCFRDPEGRKMNIEWPQDFNFMSITSRDCWIPEKKIVADLKQYDDKVTRLVSVRKLNMEWFYKDQMNFVAFSTDCLQKLPNNVYLSQFVQS